MPGAFEDLIHQPVTASSAPIDYFRGLDKRVSVGTVTPRFEASVNQIGGLQPTPPTIPERPALTMDALLGEMAARQALDAKYGTWEDLLKRPEEPPALPGSRSIALGGRSVPGGPQYTHGIDEGGVLREIPEGARFQDLTYPNPPIMAFPDLVEALGRTEANRAYAAERGASDRREADRFDARGENQRQQYFEDIRKEQKERLKKAYQFDQPGLERALAELDRRLVAKGWRSPYEGAGNIDPGALLDLLKGQ
jgi:hypothetical protein